MAVSRMPAACDSVAIEEQASGFTTAQSPDDTDQAIRSDDSDALSTCRSVSSQTILPDDNDTSSMCVSLSS
jgi:hypothetical protein